MKNSLAIAYAMKRKAKKMADGGAVDAFTKGFNDAIHTPDPEPKTMAHGGDVIDRIMAKRSKMSEGGKVANSTTVTADEMPAEYDDLVLRDDLEQHDTGENSGDMIGDEQEAADRADIVARIMASRAKRDRLPNPR